MYREVMFDILPLSIIEFLEVIMNYSKIRFNQILIFLTCIIFFIPTACNQAEKPLEFPFDHGPHDDVVTEWWYFTGEVLTEEGRTLGFEFTIFKGRSRKKDGFGFLGHIAVSDPESSKHYYTEKALPILSDIEEGMADIRLEGFTYIFSQSDGIILKAEGEEVALDLSLTPTMDVLPHGEDGIIVMGDGLNSYYYSFTNLLTVGNITIKGTEYTVSSGRTWMDHQWGNFTFFGMFWEWFSLRLENGAAIMLFQFRDIFDNKVRTNWTYRLADGSVLYGLDSSVRATRAYLDEQSKSTYPIDWTIRIDAIDAEFHVEPLFDAQSLDNRMTPDYWEGLCRAEGTVGGEHLSGSAYVELTGYND
jgi:predicted secreted hydrolase